MEYQIIINSLNNPPNQPCKSKTKNWVQINDESRGDEVMRKLIKLDLNFNGKVNLMWL